METIYIHGMNVYNKNSKLVFTYQQLTTKSVKTKSAHNNK